MTIYRSKPDIVSASYNHRLVNIGDQLRSLISQSRFRPQTFFYIENMASVNGDLMNDLNINLYLKH